jgi:hypothetical protein
MVDDYLGTTCRLPSQAFLMDGIWDRDLALNDGRRTSGH